MSNVISMTAELRERAGKGAARQTRREGRVPAVIYGNKQDSVIISLHPTELSQLMKGVGFFSHIFEIEAGGKKHKVLARDVQIDPVTDWPIHVDFMRFSATTTLNVEVNVVFLNEELSPGLKRGGVLNVVRHQIELICRADAIPEQIEIDLEGLDIGDSVHASTVKLPDGAEYAISDRDFTIATIAAPTIVTEETTEEAEGEGEGEVEGDDATVGDGDGEDKSED